MGISSSLFRPDCTVTLFHLDLWCDSFHFSGYISNLSLGSCWYNLLWQGPASRPDGPFDDGAEVPSTPRPSPSWPQWRLGTAWWEVGPPVCRSCQISGRTGWVERVDRRHRCRPDRRQWRPRQDKCLVLNRKKQLVYKINKFNKVLLALKCVTKHAWFMNFCLLVHGHVLCSTGSIIKTLNWLTHLCTPL